MQQGAPVLFSEMLTAETETPVDPWEEERRLREEAAEAEAEDDEEAEEPERPVMAPLMTPPLPGPPQREYVVVQVSAAGDESEGGARIAVPLGIRAPAPPPAPEVAYNRVHRRRDLGPAAGVRQTVQEPATAEPADEAEGMDVEGAGPEDPESPEDAARAVRGRAGLRRMPAPDDVPVSDATADAAAVPDDAPFAEAPADDAGAEPVDAAEAAADEAGSTSGEADGPDEARVQDESSEPAGPPAPLESRPIVEWPPASTYELLEITGSDDGSPAFPAPLGQAPLEAPSYSEPRGEYGVERCYAVRTLDVVAGFEVRSRLSPATCVTFVDTFPPAAPEALTAVGSQGEVSLLWRPNDEEDLAGYLVLRGSPGDETLQTVDGRAAGREHLPRRHRGAGGSIRLRGARGRHRAHAQFWRAVRPRGGDGALAALRVSAVEAAARLVGAAPRGGRYSVEAPAPRTARFPAGTAAQPPGAVSGRVPMESTYRVEHGGRVLHAVRRDGGWRALAGDPFGTPTVGESLTGAEPRVLAPVAPSKIVAVGLNYRDHAAEMNKALPAEPLIFLKRRRR